MFIFPQRAYDLPLTLGRKSRKGGSAMKAKLSIALKALGKVAKALAIVSKAGLEVLALIKG